MDVAAFVRMVRRPEGSKVPYRSQSFGRFWDSRGYPCQQPPWGHLTAIDLNKGEFRWQSLLGEFDELTARGVPKTGTPNLGGSIVTAGGLVFIAATNDSKFRAFDKETGEELWTFRLPASGHATPMTYRSRSGRQFVAIAAGGGNKYNKTFDSKLVVFALPRPGQTAWPALIHSPRKAGPPLRPGYTGIEEKLPGPAVKQPLPFSHKVHAATGTTCFDCHQSARTQARAGIPNAAACMVCHRAVKTDSPAVLAVKQYADRGTTIDWRRVYRVPDFVFFSHQRHVAGGVACADCHGPVETRDVLAKEVSVGMTACMNCHQQRKASNACNVCHELGQ
jgi:hypothetical protein